MADNIRPFVQQALPLTPIVMSQTRRQMVPDKDIRFPKVLAALQKWKTDYEDEGETCPICFESFKEVKVDADRNDPCSDPLEFNGGHEGSIVVTPCNHKFGYLCLGSWLVQKDNCPMCRNIILPLDPPQSAHRAQHRQRSYSTESQSTPADRQFMAPTPIARSISLNSIVITTPFELQRWNARFGHLNNHLDEAENVAAGEITSAIVRLPPVRASTTTHGHPTTPTSTAVEPDFIRRTYDANIINYDLTHPPRNNRTSHLNRPSIDPSWRNWDYTSRYSLREARRPRRITNSVAAAVGVSAGIGTVIGMPRAERRAPTGRDNNTSSRTESDNDFSIVRAMGHAMGLGTVVGMPRAEWRSTMRPLSPLGDLRRLRLSRSGSANDSSTETLLTARSRETSVDEDLQRLPGLASSMWARTWG
ncbi:uncharacterized protein Bfra_008662 [Botrytis fragariae]|uniref:RING-type domain-containing protein n=1 Tax=Botrytis fragariae TaxID=1964551 RepID=A0A8H6AQI6_9HELO|nr:uncharacterized protein Bfra_008662 [Botrytis fragariae]KAF5871639.1 hypothetical protein Bfra_008662 [Botrytis fragariae]